MTDLGNIPYFIAQLPQQEHAAWVAMKLIRPLRGIGTYLVQRGTGRVNARVMRLVCLGGHCSDGPPTLGTSDINVFVQKPSFSLVS